MNESSTIAPISNFIKPYEKDKTKKSRATERGDLLTYFTECVNKERDGTKYKKVRIPFIATKVSHLSTADLYYLRSSCDDARRRGYGWSKCFFGSLKVKPNET